jgi:hypothetical protein
MRSSLAVLAAVSLAACASSGTSAGPSSGGSISDRVTLSTPSGSSASSAEIHGTASTALDTLAMSTDRAWALAQSVFQGLGLQVTRVDPATHTVEGQIMRTRRPFGGKALASLLDCGEVAGVPTASRSDVTMTVVAKVQPLGDRAALATEVRAVASPMSTGATPSRCTANGGIGDLLASRFATANATPQ